MVLLLATKPLAPKHSTQLQSNHRSSSGDHFSSLRQSCQLITSVCNNLWGTPPTGKMAALSAAVSTP
jgi:hypothetical protein